MEILTKVNEWLNSEFISEEDRKILEDMTDEEIEEAYDRNGDEVNTLEIELTPQSLAESLSGSSSREQTMFWMDNGAFKFLDA